MPRLKQVPRAEASPSAIECYDKLFGDRDPVAEPGTATGTPGDWWTVFALAPHILDHAVQGFEIFGFLTGENKAKLDGALRETALIRAGYQVGSQFVFSQHCKAGRAAGLSDEKIAAIPSWPASDLFTSLERAVLGYTDALILDRGRTSDDLFAALKAGISDGEILELTYFICTYQLHATMCRALRLEYDNVDERVVEVPMPEGIDFNKMLDEMRRTKD
ncbi:MAG TPA: carboxymuconolactone decarboxylase family protein [Sneathiellales bacterium]|nr:carboxymuconolactone decarboxylase family protein [Sneathiellales bacterium]